MDTFLTQKLLTALDEGTSSLCLRYHNTELVSGFVDASSPINHKLLPQGWKHPSIYLLLIRHKSHQTAKFFKIHKINLDANIKRNIQTLNTNCRRNSRSDITLIQKAHKARTCLYHGPSSDLSKPDFFLKFIQKAMDRNNYVKRIMANTSALWQQAATGQQAKKDKTEKTMGVSRRTTEETVTWNRMTALRLQTGRRHQTSPASLRGSLYWKGVRKMELNEPGMQKSEGQNSLQWPNQAGRTLHRRNSWQ